MWIRHASEVMRGHMVVLPLKGDLMYVETIWVNSTQNELPQLKLVAVRYRGRITSGLTLEEAVRNQGLVIDRNAPPPSYTAPRPMPVARK